MADYRELIEECSKLIAERKLTVVFAESATAGKLAYEFSQTEYSGDILKGGLVCYNACVKEDILGIEKAIIEEYTPESAEVTKEMAVKLKKLMPADIVVAVTGLTHPVAARSRVNLSAQCFIASYYKISCLNARRFSPESQEGLQT